MSSGMPWPSPRISPNCPPAVRTAGPLTRGRSCGPIGGHAPAGPARPGGVCGRPNEDRRGPSAVPGRHPAPAQQAIAALSFAPNSTCELGWQPLAGRRSCSPSNRRCIGSAAGGEACGTRSGGQSRPWDPLISQRPGPSWNALSGYTRPARSI
jgi:hypothetical protein